MKHDVEPAGLLSFYFHPSIVNSDSEGAMAIMDLIAGKDVETTGFDIQFHGPHPNWFRIITQEHFPGIPDTVFRHDSLFCFRQYDRDKLSLEWRAVIDSLKTGESDKTRLEVIKNLENRVTWISCMNVATQDTRDSLMAENIVWLVRNIYPGEKIIFLAHNEHINKLNFYFRRMVEWLPDTMMKKSYVLGMSAYQGTTGSLTGRPVPLPKNKRNSLERILNSSGYDIVFCDFSKQVPSRENSWMFKKIRRQGRMRSEKKMIPAEFFDGMIQVKNVKATSFDQGNK